MADTWRRTKDLSRWRIGAALLLTPIPMLAACTLNSPTHFWAFTGIIPWFLILNLCHLAVASWRGRMSRSGCLATGVIAGGTFSDGMIIMNLAIAALFNEQSIYPPSPPLELTNLALWTNGDFLLGTLIFSLLGLFTGWLYWRFGVRGPKSNEDVSTVIS